MMPISSEEEEIAKQSFQRFYEAWHFGAHYSEGTHRRWKRKRGIKDEMPIAEAKFLRHAWITTEYYLAEMERCFNGEAHLAVGLLSMALFELLLQMALLSRQSEIRKIRYFQDLSRKSRKSPKSRPAFLKVLTSLTLEQLISLARRAGLFEGLKFSDQVHVVIESCGYPKDVDGTLKYLRDCRNHIHPRAMAYTVPSIVLRGNPDPHKTLTGFHADFAFVALHVREAVSRSLPYGNSRMLRAF